MAIASFTFCAVSGLPPAAHVGGATVEEETISGANAATTAAATASQGYCRVAVDTDCYVSFGTAPDASSDSVRFLMPAGSVEYFHVASGSKAAVVATS